MEETKDPSREHKTEETLRSLEKEYVLVGKERMKPWQLWLFIGLLAGVVTGVVLVANRRGTLSPSRATAPEAPKAERPQYAPGEVIVKFKKEAAPAGGVFMRDSKPSPADTQFLQQHKLKSSKRILKGFAFKNAAVRALVEAKGVDRLYAVEVEGRVEDAIATLEKDPRVEYAEPNFIVKTSAAPVFPNDPSFSNLWGMNNTGQTGGTVDADIDAPEAWLIAKDSGVPVGIIDTGVDYTHEDLIANTWKNLGETADNGIDDDGNGFIDDVYGWDFANNDNDPMDDFGHGTHVAGTIGAVGNNGVGVAGVNWSAKIASIKFLNAGGSGTIDGAVKSVQYANMMGFKITNNSWGGGGFSQALYDAIAAGDTAGNLFVAAAGNSGQDADSAPMYPAAYDLPNIISVAATDHADHRAYFSSYGLKSVDLGAPGVNVYSSVPKSGCALCDASGYRNLSGTSMATPHVAGAAALLWAKKPSFTHQDVKAALLGGVDANGDLAGKTVSGGRLNVNNVFEEDNVPPAKVGDLKAADSTHSSVMLNWKAVGDDDFLGRASRYDIRYAASPITEVNFKLAKEALNEPVPQPSGSMEAFAVRGLAQNTSYYFALKVYDNMGNGSPLSNVASFKTKIAKVVFSDNMEQGVGSWMAEGTDGKGGQALWHQSKRKAVSPVSAWYYGDESSGNYDTGARNWGSITSGDISLASVQGAELTFQHYLATENLFPFDLGQIQISKDGGASWTTVLQKTGTGGEWIKESIDLSGFDFSVIKVRFLFDTGDSLFNKFEGWYVDDVAILGTPSVNKKPVASAGGPYAGDEDQVIKFDGSKSHDPEGRPLSYKWDFGDGVSTITKNPQIEYAYSGGGVFTVKLVVNDGGLDSIPSATKATIKEINDQPVAIPQSTFLVNREISFDGSRSFDIDGPPLAYMWDFGDGTGGKGRVVTHKYDAPGTYTVVLKVSDGQLANTSSVTVRVDLYDEFDRPDSTTLGNGWVEAQGDLMISNGELKNGPPPPGTYHIAVLPGLSGGAERVSGDFVSVSNASVPRFGVVLRYQDPKNYYLIYRKGGYGRSLNISVVVNGKENVLKSIPVSDPPVNSFFRLGGRVVGDTLILELDGINRLVVTDTTFSNGLVGIYMGSKSATQSPRADNIQADAFPGDPGKGAMPLSPTAVPVEVEVEPEGEIQR